MSKFSTVISVLDTIKMRKLAQMAPFLLTLLLAGCFETSQTFILNPDGSGKVVLESRFQTLSLAGERLDETQLKEEVSETMEKSEGVDAWTDVSYHLEPDGRIYFKGTAYFKDINSLNLDKGSNVRWTKDGSDMILEVIGRNEEEEESQPSPPGKLTDAEIQARIKAQRDEWTHSKPLMESMLNTLTLAAVFQLPGRVTAVNNLKKTGDNSVSFLLEGVKMVKAIDSLMADDAWMRKKALSGAFENPDDGPPMGADVNERTFGQKGEVTARVSGEMKALFDYAAEVEIVKKNTKTQSY